MREMYVKPPITAVTATFAEHRFLQEVMFCPKCGTAVYVPPTAPQQPPPYYDRRAYKDARRQQRRQEKAEKNVKGEKGEKGGGGALIGPIIGGASRLSELSLVIFPWFPWS